MELPSKLHILSLDKIVHHVSLRRIDNTTYECSRYLKGDTIKSKRTEENDTFNHYDEN